MDHGTEQLVTNLPFLIAQSPLVPYLLIAATTEAEKLAQYLKEPNGGQTKTAITEATANSLTMDVPRLMEILLSFFDQFASWCSCTRGYLKATGWEKAPIKADYLETSVPGETTPITSDY
jgi:translation elongation factor EF-4